MADPINYEQAAILAGVTERHLHRLIADGDAPQPIDSRLPVKEFAEWLDKRKRGTDFDLARTRLTQAQADKTELEVAELAGDLVRAEEVTTAWGDKIAAARSRFLALPSKLAARVAPPGKTAEVHALAQATVYEALEELAGDGLPERARARRAAHAPDLAPAAKPNRKPVGGRKPKAKPRVKR